MIGRSILLTRWLLELCVEACLITQCPLHEIICCSRVTREEKTLWCTLTGPHPSPVPPLKLSLTFTLTHVTLMSLSKQTMWATESERLEVRAGLSWSCVCLMGKMPQRGNQSRGEKVRRIIPTVWVMNHSRHEMWFGWMCAREHASDVPEMNCHLCACAFIYLFKLLLFSSHDLMSRLHCAISPFSSRLHVSTFNSGGPTVWVSFLKGAPSSIRREKHFFMLKQTK